MLNSLTKLKDRIARIAWNWYVRANDYSRVTKHEIKTRYSKARGAAAPVVVTLDIHSGDHGHRNKEGK